MTVLGLCAECGQPSSSSCRGCGKAVCRDHVDLRTGMCAACARRLGAARTPPGEVEGDLGHPGGVGSGGSGPVLAFYHNR